MNVKKLIPNIKIPQGFFEAPVKPTTFDFTKRDTLNVKTKIGLYMNFIKHKFLYRLQIKKS